MYELPLFPLGTVLFPNMPVTLHIFEERYKEMINHCITESQPFGVVLIQQGQEAGSAVAQPYEIGCAAHIAQVQPVQDGRMNIVGIGRERFKIKSISYNKPYLVGSVEDIELTPAPEEKRAHIGSILLNAITDYLTTLSDVGEMEFSVDQLPKDPTELAYLSATLLQTPNETKQSLLEINDELQLLRDVYDTYRKEVSILKEMLKPNVKPIQASPFSLN